MDNNRKTNRHNKLKLITKVKMKKRKNKKYNNFKIKKTVYFQVSWKKLIVLNNKKIK